MLSDPIDCSNFFFQRFRSGDQLAFEQIFKAHYNRIVGFCKQFIGDHDKSQSLAQEAFINLWINRAKIERMNGIRSFLYTYAKSGCLNYIRHNMVVQKYTDRYLHDKENQINREVLESFDFYSFEFVELETLIRHVVEKLPDRCRQTFILSRFEGKSNKEIALVLGISVKTVEAALTRSFKILKNKLSDYFPAILVSFLFTYL
ncbi:MAG: RNA polymerase sigma-70 factor [Mangrovibacterium sp.]